MIYYEEYGDSHNPAIVFLHGANLVQSFVMQYGLKEKYHLIVPHITGYGKEAGTVFTTEKAVSDLTELIESLNQKVVLVGFSLGAQLAFVLAAEHQELFRCVIAVSPWLIKDKAYVNDIVEKNKKGFKLYKSKLMVKIMGKSAKLDKKQTQELIQHCQALQLDTLVNSIDNGIEIEKYPQFSQVKIPFVALCGAKEPDIVSDSLKKLKEVNPLCETEIWEKAAHNIPVRLSQRLIDKILSTIKKADN